MTLERPGQVDPYEKSTFQPMLQVKRVQNTTTHTVWAPSPLSPPVYALSIRRSFPPNLLMTFWRSHQVHPNPAHAKNKSLEHHKGISPAWWREERVRSSYTALAESDTAPGAARSNERRGWTQASLYLPLLGSQGPPTRMQSLCRELFLTDTQ